ncbi:MAG: hypothetical protein HZC52_09670 [Planctomycetes bacterium]|nr:hypothetical protein [Planctomycetota bacterium]
MELYRLPKKHVKLLQLLCDRPLEYPELYNLLQSPKYPEEIDELNTWFHNKKQNKDNEIIFKVYDMLNKKLSNGDSIFSLLLELENIKNLQTYLSLSTIILESDPKGNNI